MLTHVSEQKRGAATRDDDTIRKSPSHTKFFQTQSAHLPPEDALAETCNNPSINASKVMSIMYILARQNTHDAR